VKISPVDTEIALLIVKKKEEITEGKIYSPFSNLAERAKLWKVKYIARSAGLIIFIHH